MSQHGSLSRPSPPRGPRQVVDDWWSWVAWVGPFRLLGGVVAVGAFGVAVILLVRSEPPSTESTLPMVSVVAPDVVAPDVVDSDVVDSGAAPPASTGPMAVVVHVAGSVARPGVYRLESTARVIDVIDVAGGPVGSADLDGLNLASPIVDGQRVYVPEIGEVAPRLVPSGGSGGPKEGSAATPLDLNRATVDQLDALPGIGPSTAAAIVGDRDANGPFASVDDLERVPGIGPAKLAALRDLVVV
ncbi:MAG: helix-hairpin-helix domain-containing protein [Ilumatobacteraceae bacterium]